MVDYVKCQHRLKSFLHHCVTKLALSLAHGLPPAFRRQGDNSAAAADDDDGGLWRDVPREYYSQGARLGRGGLL